MIIPKFEDFIIQHCSKTKQNRTKQQIQSGLVFE